MSGLKTSFSRLDPIPRGQATVIKSSVRCSPRRTSKQQRPRATSFLPTSSPSTISGRLGHPWVHRNWARTSRVKNPKHLEASRSIFSSRYMQNRHQAQKPMQTCIFFKRQTRRSQPVSLDTNRFGGAERDRTADPLLAKQVLSQLSYSPISSIARYKPGSATFRISHIPSSPTLIRKCKWWAREDLNFRPHAYQACALTN